MCLNNSRNLHFPEALPKTFMCLSWLKNMFLNEKINMRYLFQNVALLLEVDFLKKSRNSGDKKLY